jgi:hypothetical protein
VAEKPIAGVDLEAEQIIEEEAEKPVSAGRRKSRPWLLILGGAMVVEAVIVAFVFSIIGGGSAGAGAPEPAEAGPSLRMETLKGLVAGSVIEVGDVSHSMPNPQSPGRSIEVTLKGVSVSFNKDASEMLQTLFGENEGAEAVIQDELRAQIRAFLLEVGVEHVKRRSVKLEQEIEAWLRDPSRSRDLAGLGECVIRVSYEQLKAR